MLAIEGEGRGEDYFAMRSWVQDEIRDEPHPRGFNRIRKGGQGQIHEENFTFFPNYLILKPQGTWFRFFSTAVVDEHCKVWHVWVTAACDRQTGQEYIADIRLGPNGYSSSAPPGENRLPAALWFILM